ncbi:MAG: glutamine--fructose-6-phosphate transaminase (isomerizing), partial [Clostridia bacterium]|nr:glutamine--fructose-6-phosphate transaminase (isomerizing) [Clostridia bacterium]
MCGIIGFTGFKNAVPLLLDGLSSLEYRGYDSAGIAIFNDCGNIEIYKAKGRLLNLRKKIDECDKAPSGFCGIGHTRWATHGEPSDINSHPHGTKNVQIVHNGIIENFSELKEQLIKDNGYSFISETDTEVASCVIDSFYKECHDPYDAMTKAISVLRGSYAIAAIFRDYPGKIFATRKDNPMIIAVSDNGNFIASDIPAILKHTRKYYHIFEGEIAEVTSTSVTIFNSEKEPIERALEKADWDIEAAEKGGYPHFMIKEIGEEPDSIIKTLSPRIKDEMPDFGIDNLSDEKLASFTKIHLAACGTAMHAGLVGKYAIEKLARVPVEVEIASEFRYKDPILNKSELAIIISQSGETADTLAALKLAKKKGLFTLAIVNVAGSTIAREADAVLYTWAGPEIAVASTKAYTVQISVMYLFALRLAYAKGLLSEKKLKAYVNELMNEAPLAVK